MECLLSHQLLMATQFSQVYEVRTIINSILQMKKLRQERVELAGGHTLRGWESWNSDLRKLVSKCMLLTTRFPGLGDAFLKWASFPLALRSALLGPGPTFPWFSLFHQKLHCQTVYVFSSFSSPNPHLLLLFNCLHKEWMIQCLTVEETYIGVPKTVPAMLRCWIYFCCMLKQIHKY